MQKKIDTVCYGFISLPNILLKKRVVPELLQSKLTPKTIVAEVEENILNKKNKMIVQTEMKALRQQIGKENGGIQELVKKIVIQFDLK